MTGNDIRGIVLDQCYRTGANHIGSCLSVADILAALYGGILRGEGPDDPERDRFVLSKGHAAYALYAALMLRGWLKPGEIAAAFNHEHPDYRTPGVEFSTGSLGMGITYAVGQALALKLRGSAARAFCLVSDAECQEGSVWEAADIASREALANLTVIVDSNGQQALGPMPGNNERLLARWHAFGWDTWGDVGHDLQNINRRDHHKPTAVVVRTISGKGVSFMERSLDWHYRSLDAETYKKAKAELA